MTRFVTLLAVVAVLGGPVGALANDRTFEAGSLIVPMDIEYQDVGMIQAYGLLYQLLLADIPIYWVIKTPKTLGEVDFVASGADLATGDPISSHGYRGGPFVVDSADADKAKPVISQWQTTHTTAVHETSAPFTGFVSRELIAAPLISILATGNEDISFNYMNAAGIPDSKGQPWPEKKDKTGVYPGYPDILDIAEIRGPTITSQTDGALFDGSGLPVYCELMTMHWDVNDRDDDAIAEIREFLYYPTHFFAECQSVNAVENSVNGLFLTPNGYIMDGKPDDVTFLNPFLPYSQMDGEFKTVGGSEASYTLPEGDEYYDDGVVMLTEAATPLGTRDVWMTGYVDGECDIIIEEPGGRTVRQEEDCPGKVSYLGGHKYSTETPVSENPDSQGTRFFLNALFEADCLTTVGAPDPVLIIEGPAFTTVPTVSYTISVDNKGDGVAYDAVVAFELPANMVFQSSSVPPDSVVGNTITWDRKNLKPNSEAEIEMTVSLAVKGTYDLQGEMAYRIGQNPRITQSNPLSTEYGDEDDTDSGDDDDDTDSGDDDDTDGDQDGGVEDGGIDDGGPINDAGGDSADGDSGACGCATLSAPSTSVGQLLLAILPL